MPRGTARCAREAGRKKRRVAVRVGDAKGWELGVARRLACMDAHMQAWACTCLQPIIDASKAKEGGRRCKIRVFMIVIIVLHLSCY
jgi:hypothetical protein